MNLYMGLEILENSKYMKCNKLICLQDINFLIIQCIKKINAANTYLLMIDNYDNINCEDIFNNLIDSSNFK